MKYLFFLLLAVSTQISFAQSNATPAKTGIQKMVKMYDLNPQQTSQYIQIMDNKKADIIELKSRSKDGQLDMEKLAEINEKYEGSLLAILDERQTKIYKIQKQMAQQVIQKKANPE